MIITHKLQPMDLTHKQNTIRIDVVQDDKYSRDIEFTLTENGVAWQIPDGTTAVVRYKKPDGTGGNYDTLPDGSTAYRISGNVLTVALAPQVCTVQGTVQLSVGLIQGSAEINTFTVNIVVHPNPGATYQSEDYIKLSGAVPNSGWTPNMYLGTDASGNVVAKDGTSGGGASGDYIPIPATATVGQTIVVKAVDENGKPTEWEAADISAAQTYEVLFEVEEAVESVEWDFVDDEGNPVLLQEVEVVQHFISTNQSGADLNAKILLSDGNTKYVMIANNFANTAGNWVAAVSVAKIYGETLYALSNKNVSSIGSLDYTGGFTRQGVSYPKGWGDRWSGLNGVKIRGIIGLKVPSAVGAKSQFYVCGVKAK